MGRSRGAKGAGGARRTAQEFSALYMMKLHANVKGMNRATLTERGQISVPAALRKSMKLKPGQRLKFVPVSAHEFRVIAEVSVPPGPMAVLGYARKLRPGPARRTGDWMRELREGER